SFCGFLCRYTKGSLNKGPECAKGVTCSVGARSFSLIGGGEKCYGATAQIHSVANALLRGIHVGKISIGPGYRGVVRSQRFLIDCKCSFEERNGLGIPTLVGIHYS